MKLFTEIWGFVKFDSLKDFLGFVKFATILCAICVGPVALWDLGNHPVQQVHHCSSIVVDLDKHTTSCDDQ